MYKKLPPNITEQISLPVIAAPIFLVTSPEMVLAFCKSGIIGSFPLLNARTVDILDDWMKRITDELATLRIENPDLVISPWTVNLIVHPTNKRYEVDLERIKKYKPPIVITSLGDPSPVGGLR